ncbi:tRNA pseudouridine(55) synthase TruB [Olivibacter sitiensis]|uniref:tRNA pseudouridine(55) synthase TruB n=1 Tax=Olivibacter sitiensis TaxID=376470 RepID=UPI00040F75D2|nr:tRNA pseudouridine(55) synthase TruB [Olivibacter sitiensis]
MKDRKFDFEGGEVLLVDKPYKWTSFDVVSKIRNSLKPLKIKVGHAGTLDPLATGLLIVCTGKKTKTIDELQAQEKEYTGSFVLGSTTPTYDLESEPSEAVSLEGLSEDKINSACALFLGNIEQYPPAHSAVKVGGERLYEKARRGEEIELKARAVTIMAFDITRIDLPEVDFRVVCSKGTYIRSLAHDFGQTLGVGAYLGALRRTRSGDFHVDDAFQVLDLTEHIKSLKTKTEQ